MLGKLRKRLASGSAMGRVVEDALTGVAMRVIGKRLLALTYEIERIAGSPVGAAGGPDRTSGPEVDRERGHRGARAGSRPAPSEQPIPLQGRFLSLLGQRIELASYDALSELAAAIERLAAKLAADARSREHSERSLLAREQQYRTLFEQSRDAIIISRPSGEIIDVNQSALELFGYAREEMLAFNARYLYADPHERERFMREIAHSGSVRIFETRLHTKDGQLIDCAISATAQRSDDGSAVSYQSVVRDITRQRLSEKLLAEYSQTLERQVAGRTQELRRTLDELKTAQAQLVEAEKMAALGGLVAGVAHEINTPIGIGVTAASLLETRTREVREHFDGGALKRSDFVKYLDTAAQSSRIILANLERAAELIRSFKQVAVDQSSEQRRAFAIRGYLQEVLLSLHPKLKRTRHSIEIRGDDNVIVNSYPGAFAQIVTNLVMNSLIHAYGPDDMGRIVFDIRRLKSPSGESRIALEYSDDGCGIPDEHLGRVFEPFFSTKRGQGGSGLGLHIVYNLVTQRLKGTIRCESEVGRGTSFIIEMPLTQ